MPNSWQPHGLQHALSCTIYWSLLSLMSIELVMLSSHLILCCPLLYLQYFPASGSFPVCQLVTSGGQSFGASASVFPMNIQISCRIDWFDLLAVQETLESLLQHPNSKHQFCVQSCLWSNSHPYMTIEKNIELTI